MPSAISFRPNRPGIVSEVLDGEAIIVNLESGAYYSLTSADIWMAAESGATRAEIIYRIGAKFNGTPPENNAGVIALIITHRYTAAMQADIIHVMDQGRVVESGTHSELIECGGCYAASWRLQMREQMPGPGQASEIGNDTPARAAAV